jgi:nucleotide-binding universal stress UspA family protein
LQLDSGNREGGWYSQLAEKGNAMAWFSDKTFVVPVDLSEHSLNALDQALAMSVSPSQIHVIHVLAEPRMDDAVAWAVMDMDAEVRKTTQLLQDRFQDEKFHGIKLHVCHGDAGTEIAKYAEHIKADLVVISSHGRRGWKRLLIGSVAERVVRLAHCDVFVLKPKV